MIICNNCKPIQIIFGHGKIWNKLTNGKFDIYLLCAYSLSVASLHRKMTPIFISIP